MKILLACQTATNKGDRAIAEYLINNFINQGHEVVLSTTRPFLWTGLKDRRITVIRMGYKSIYRHMKSKFASKMFRGFNKYIYNKFLFADLLSEKGKHRFCRLVSKEFIENVREADLVVVTGGHHITSIREKNALFQFTYDIGLISLYAKRYVLWSQTIGPLEFTSKKAEKFIENIIMKAQKVYVRDYNSLECIKENFGNAHNVVKTYDSVFGYGSMDFADISQREKKVGIAVFDGLKKAFGTYDVLAKLLDRYASAGYSIEFFRMEYDDFEQDSINYIISLMKQGADIKIYPFLTTSEEHLREVASCRCFIGYKTHSVIMALATNTPLIAIAYHQKTIDFMNDFRLGEYALSDEELDFAKAENCMISLEKNIEKIRLTQREVAKTTAERVQNDLFEMVNNE